MKVASAAVSSRRVRAAHRLAPPRPHPRRAVHRRARAVDRAALPHRPRARLRRQRGGVRARLGGLPRLPALRRALARAPLRPRGAAPRAAAQPGRHAGGVAAVRGGLLPAARHARRGRRARLARDLRADRAATRNPGGARARRPHRRQRRRGHGLPRGRLHARDAQAQLRLPLGGGQPRLHRRAGAGGPADGRSADGPRQPAARGAGGPDLGRGAVGDLPLPARPADELDLRHVRGGRRRGASAKTGFDSRRDDRRTATDAARRRAPTGRTPAAGAVLPALPRVQRLLRGLPRVRRRRPGLVDAAAGAILQRPERRAGRGGGAADGLALGARG